MKGYAIRDSKNDAIGVIYDEDKIDAIIDFGLFCDIYERRLGKQEKLSMAGSRKRFLICDEKYMICPDLYFSNK